MVKLEKETKKLQRQDYLPDIKILKSHNKFKLKAYQQKTDPEGNTVKVDKIKKRSVYWVKKVQK